MAAPPGEEKRCGLIGLESPGNAQDFTRGLSYRRQPCISTGNEWNNTIKSTLRMRFPCPPIRLLLAALIPFCAPAFAQDSVASIPKLEFEKYTLSNGLQVILHVDRKLPMVHVNSWYHVGSKNERIGRTGFAHLFEHMMFEGAKDSNGKYFTYIEKAGANLFEGGVNGTTSEDRTNYFDTVPSSNLEYVLWLESDRLATLTDVLTKTKLDNERDIVKNERRQSLENQPYARWYYLLAENLFPYGHPYAHSVIGSTEDLTAASVDDVKDFFLRYYTPNNLSLAITGDFDPAQAKNLVEKYYASIPPGPPLERAKRSIPRLEAPKVLEVKDHVPQERVYFAWPSPAYFDSGDADLELLAFVLSDGLSARLNKSLVYDKQLCSDVTAFQNSNEIAGAFVIWATATPGASLPAIEQILTAELAKLAKSGPTPEELKRAQTKWEMGYLTGLERIGGFGGQADMLNQYNTFLGDPDKFAADVNRHRMATVESVRLAAAQWLDTPNRLVMRFHPEADKPDPKVIVDRTQTPAFGVDQPFHAPDVETAKLSNGVNVFVVERKDLPKVSVALGARAGSIADPKGKEGLSSLLLEVAKRGTATQSAMQIDNALGDLGTDLSVRSRPEYASISLEVLSRNLDPAVAELANVALHPSFPPEELDREKKKRLDAIAQEENDPNGVARRVASMLAFGRSSVYGHPGDGFRSSVTAITGADLNTFHDTYWKPGTSAVFFVGDISLQRATELADKYFGSWQGGEAPAVSIAAPQPEGNGKVIMINRPDSAQTMVMEILAGPSRSAADYYALSLADTAWGGSVTARLGMNLREKHGYSYGVFSFPTAYTKFGEWVAQGSVQTDKTKESVVEFRNELHAIAGEKQVSSDELARIRSYRARGYAQQFESMSRVSGQLMQLWAVGMPMTELQREPDELQKVTLDSVNAAAEKYANPGHATLLLVGDLSKIESGVRSLGLGPVEILDVEGRPVSH